jgi:hypothetical protein
MLGALNWGRDVETEQAIQRITLRRNEFCVYRHVVNGEVVYVGMGTSQRPFMINPGGEHCPRGTTWSLAIGASPEITAEIIGWYENAPLARKAERAEIRRLRPIGNVNIRPNALTAEESREEDRAAFIENSRLLAEFRAIRVKQ